MPRSALTLATHVALAAVGCTTPTQLDAGSDGGERVDAPADTAGLDVPALDAGTPPTLTISPTLYSTFFLVDGVAYGCGSNANGHLGVDDPFLDTYRRPAALAFPAGVTVRQLEAGGHGGVALDDTGHVYTWGDNMTGELGVGTVDSTRADRPELRSLDADGAMFDHVVQITVGYQFVGALRDDGSVWVWGLNGRDGTTDASGVVGLPIPTGMCPWFGGGEANCYAPLPRRITFPEPVRITAIHASDFSMMAIDEAGAVWSWGGSASPSGTSTSTPVRWPGLPPVVALSAGRGVTYAIDGDRDLWTWSTLRPDARRVTDGPAFAFLRGRVRAVEASGHSVHVLDDAGVLWGWGDQQVGEVGNGPPGLDPLSRDADGCLNANYDFATQELVPEPVEILTDVAAVFSNSFSYSVFAQRVDGSLWAWGRNKVFGLCNDPAALSDCAAPVPHADAYNEGEPVPIAAPGM